MIWAWLRRKIGFVRPVRETYVRTSRPSEKTGLTIEPGVEFREGDTFADVTQDLYSCCFQADLAGVYTPIAMAIEVARLIELKWPGRAYFVEAHSPDGWIQIFQPFGIPRNK